jgi:hypothetical protein
MGAKAFSRIEKGGMDRVFKGCAEVFRRMRLSPRKHTTFLHDPRREFHKYRCAFAFGGKGSMRDWRGRGRIGRFGWRRDALLSIGGGRGSRLGLGS